MNGDTAPVPETNDVVTPTPHSIPTIRTYEGDIANLISRKGTSSADMAIAENKRRTGQDDVIANTEPTHTGKNSLIAVISLLLIVVGMVGAYYLYSISPLAPSGTTATTQPAKIPSLVPSDTQFALPIDSLSANQVIKKIQAEVAAPKPANSIEEIVLYTTDASGSKIRETAAQMIVRMDIPAPSALTRSLTPSWMLGVYTDENNGRNIFVVVENNFFQNAFSGMLSWEKVMPDDLKQYLYSVVPAGIANTPLISATTASRYANSLQNLNSLLPTSTSTSTASTTSLATSTSTSSPATTKSRSATSTTPLATSTSTSVATTSIVVEAPIVPYFTLRGQFQDRMVKNRDVREFITVDNRTLFLYSFIDNSKLVIAPNEKTLAEILTRLEKRSFVR
ncbi:MAG: hypothetical protein WCG02_01920 [Candidatus Taylorbacteria bacterium]